MENAWVHYEISGPSYLGLREENSPMKNVFCVSAEKGKINGVHHYFPGDM